MLFYANYPSSGNILWVALIFMRLNYYKLLHANIYLSRRQYQIVIKILYCVHHSHKEQQFN